MLQCIWIVVSNLLSIGIYDTIPGCFRLCAQCQISVPAIWEDYRLRALRVCVTRYSSVVGHFCYRLHIKKRYILSVRLQQAYYYYLPKKQKESIYLSIKLRQVRSQNITFKLVRWHDSILKHYYLQYKINFVSAKTAHIKVRVVIIILLYTLFSIVALNCLLVNWTTW